MNRASHTTKAGKAKCLAYRNGSRCGRVATAEVRYTARVYRHMAVCQKCADEIVQTHGPDVVRQSSPKGFTVHNACGFSGMTAREYRSIT